MEPNNHGLNTTKSALMPKVAIIIPCYNLDGYLDNCLNSCILQSYRNIQIIAINDGSTDNTGQTIDQYAAVDNRIMALHLENGGVSRARKIAIAKSDADFFFFLDGDDSMPLNTIELMVNAAMQSEADIVVANMFWERENGFELVENPQIGKIDSLGFIRRLVAERDFSLGAKIYASKLFTSDINYFEDLKRGEDALLSMQLIKKANYVFGIPDVAYYYRNRLTSISRTNNPKTSYFHQVFEARFKVEEFALECGVDKSDFGLARYICFALVVYLTNVGRTNLSRKLIKEKTNTYLIQNTGFKKYYKQHFKKNYYRLVMYYYFMMPHKLFSMFYKLFGKLL